MKITKSENKVNFFTSSGIGRGWVKNNSLITLKDYGQISLLMLSEFKQFNFYSLFRCFSVFCNKYWVDFYTVTFKF